MEATRTMKGIDDTTWKEFKTLAKSKKLTSGELFRYMIHTFEKRNTEEAWNKILNRKPSLTEKEADDMQKKVKEWRKERGFRL